MDRKKLYAEIISLGLQSEIKALYGRNFTTCSNTQLFSVIKKARESLNKVCGNSSKSDHNSLFKLISILAKKKILLKSEVDEIVNA